MRDVYILELEKRYEELERQKINRIIKIIVLIVLILSFIVLTVYLLTSPEIKLKKSKEITLIYPEKYKEPGYKAKAIGTNLTKKVKISGKVNSAKLGTYVLTYKVKNFIFTSVVTRNVKVVDKEKPEIVLKGSEETYVCPNTKYKEEGYEVIDNYNKNLNSVLKTKESSNEIVYTVTDASGNKAKKTRKLIYEDKIKPEIKLKGSSNMYIYVGSSFKEPGYSATDNCDGDITSNVKVSGSVNTSKVGSYTLTYTVTDASGNETKVLRKVTVMQVRKASGCGIAGAIYLTFDDGPNASSTAQILNILREEGVKATFFVTNAGPDALIKREYDEGHTVALHTASHRYDKVYSSVNAYFDDLNTVSNRVKRITGYTPKIIRFPGGSGNTVSKNYFNGIMSILTNEVVNRGYKYYDWSISSEDAGACAKSKSSACVYNTTIKYLSKNKCNMVLMHDVKSYTVDAVRNVIRYGKENGYIFKQIDNTTPMVTQRVNN